MYHHEIDIVMLGNDNSIIDMLCGAPRQVFWHCYLPSNIYIANYCRMYIFCDIRPLVLMFPLYFHDKSNCRPGGCCQTTRSPLVSHLIHSMFVWGLTMTVTVTASLTVARTMFTSRAGPPPPLSHWTRSIVTMRSTDLDQTPDHSPAPTSPSPSNQIHLDLEQGSLPWLPEMRRWQQI